MHNNDAETLGCLFVYIYSFIDTHTALCTAALGDCTEHRNKHNIF